MIELREASTMAKICDLSDCITATVTEALNSSFEMTLTYPCVGEGFTRLAVNRLISCKPNPYSTEEIFRIYKISKPINGICTVYAEHISYSMNSYVCFPNMDYSESGGSAANLIGYMTMCAGTNSAKSGYYSLGFTTNIERFENWGIDNHRTLKDVMSYAQGLFGGEWKFTSTYCSLLNHRGSDRGVALQYGENIIDVTHTQDNSTRYTHIMPFARYKEEGSDEEKYSYCDEYFYSLNSGYSGSNYFKPYILDVTDFEGVDYWVQTHQKPPSVNILTAAMQWAQLNGDVIGTDDVNVSVQVIQRGKTAEYAHLTNADHIELGDSITVSASKVGIPSVTKRVVKVVYDVISDRITSVELGTLKKSLQDTAAKVQKREDDENADTRKEEGSNGGSESSEIPKEIVKVSSNEVYFLFDGKKVTWTASGSGNTRKNFKKTVEDINDSGGDSDDTQTGA